ncbi:hypothetical protein [Paenibacillus sp. FSL L8-0463]|uniref:hypothetical protein n=1 Tax=Paenibacillus sp. FSL L8-0463 TaxID=2954687 RepID=UPI00311A47CD
MDDTEKEGNRSLATKPHHPLKAQATGEEPTVPLVFFAALTLRNRGYPVARKGKTAKAARAGKGGLPAVPEAAAWMTLAARCKAYQGA